MDQHDIQLHHRPQSPAGKPPETPAENGTSAIRGRLDSGFCFTWIICMVTWLILSGKFDAFHLGLGVLSSTLVAFVSGDLLLAGAPISRFPIVAWRFMKFLPWLLVQVFIANIHVMRLVFHPRMKQHIRPRIVRFKCRLQGDMPRLVLANAITLTPGTITVFASVMGSVTVHVIDEKSAEGVPGEMEHRIAEIYGE